MEISIYCVDGDTIYSMISPNKEHLLKFLKDHDHEGSDLMFRYWENGELVALERNPELIYGSINGIE